MNAACLAHSDGKCRRTAPCQDACGLRVQPVKFTAVQIGTLVPQWSRKQFSTLPSDIDMDRVWQLIGPQVDMHIRGLPLWRVFCAVYLEGLTHGAQAREQDQQTAQAAGSTQKP